MWVINKRAILRLCPDYVRFNKSIIDDILVEDEERIDIANIENDDHYAREYSEGEESDYSDTETMRQLFTEEYF